MSNNGLNPFNQPRFIDAFEALPAPLIDDQGSTVYQGYVKEWGVGTDEAKWMIKRITSAGGVTTTEYAGGRGFKFEYVWDDRASLSYGR